jgi:hypothetical protein
VRSPKPLEFGNAGENWEGVGWRVSVQFTELANTIRPKDHIEILRPVLPAKYSPLQPNGNGLQSVYLTEVPTPLAEVLIVADRPRSLALGAIGHKRRSDFNGRLGCVGAQDRARRRPRPVNS